MSTTRILAIGDLHIQPTNLTEVSIFLFELEEFLKKNTFDLIVILGDTLHTHEIINTQCLNKMIEYLNVCKRYAPMKFLVGNHEYINNSQFLTKNHPFNTFEDVIDTPRILEVKEFQIGMCPYVPDGRLIEALNTLSSSSSDSHHSSESSRSPEWLSCSVIFAHQLLDGAKMGPILAKGVEEWKEEYPFIVSGHIHDNQRFNNVYYPGSAMAVSYAENKNHILAIITLSENTPPFIEEINIHPPSKKTIYTDIKDIQNLSLSEEKNTKVKVSVSGDSDEFKTFTKTKEYKSLIEKGVKVVFKNKKSKECNIPSVSNVSNEKNTFDEILYSLVSKDERNKELLDVYFELINPKVDVLFE